MKNNKFCKEQMNKINILALTVTFLIFSACTGNRGNGSSSPGVKDGSKEPSEISFSEYQHDFGKVSEGEKLSYTFSFENTGKSDLILSSVSTTCGCTVPKYDRKPIHPGSSGNLEVVFDTSGKNGTQSKTITVHSNASKPVVILKITAEVTPGDR